MKKPIITTIVLAFMTGIALAAPIADITGTWVCSLKLADGNSIALTYNFKQDKDKVTGKVDSPQGELTIENGNIAGDSIKFNVNIQGYDFPHAGKIYADSIAIDVISQGEKLHTVLSKKRSN